MKRRGFLASLIVAPAAAKVVAEAKPVEVQPVQLMMASDDLVRCMSMSMPYSLGDSHHKVVTYKWLEKSTTNSTGF